jgi:hypothetical protein
LSVTIPLHLSSVRQGKKGVLPHPELRYVTAGIRYHELPRIPERRSS